MLFFGPELGAFTAAGVVLWRAFTFYIPVLVCVPLLGLRSKMGPAERLEEFGEAHVGVEGARDTLRIARRRTVEALRRGRCPDSRPRAQARGPGVCGGAPGAGGGCGGAPGAPTRMAADASLAPQGRRIVADV